MCNCFKVATEQRIMQLAYQCYFRSHRRLSENVATRRAISGVVPAIFIGGGLCRDVPASSSTLVSIERVAVALGAMSASLDLMNSAIDFREVTGN